MSSEARCTRDICEENVGLNGEAVAENRTVYRQVAKVSIPEGIRKKSQVRTITHKDRILSASTGLLSQTLVVLHFKVLIIRYDKMVSHMMKCHMCIKEVHHSSHDPGIVVPSIG